MLLFEWLVSGAGGFVGSGGGGGEAPLSPGEWWALAGICFLLVAFAGLASGLTLGLMSLDAVDVEVLRRSGTPDEKRCADAIAPVIANEHFLLVTLLLCNAAANEALPLFLDRLADPVTAVVLSTTVVLVFGEVVPQALCSRYGLQIGASSAWLVRGLMLVTAPLSWPIGRLLDALLGGEHTALFRRAQLKALVGLHAEGEGLGGTLSADEIAVITGALDLTHKTAHAAMTALGSVFMLPAERAVDEACLQEILSRGHSRVPVFTGGDRCGGGDGGGGGVS
jgi:metal transporter CNNM